MKLVPKPPTLSVIIDAGYIHKVGDQILDIVRRNAPPTTIGGSYYLRGMVRKAAFWLPVIAGLPTIARRVNPGSEAPINVRTFLFDALYSPGATGLTTTAGDHKLQETDGMARAAAERAFVYWFAPKPLFNDPTEAAGKGPSIPMTSGTLHTDDGDVDYSFCVPMNERLIHIGATDYDRPGLYLGYLSADDRDKRGVTQKEVDTMMALCMLLEAQRGHTVVFVGQDTDLIPAAQLASQYQRIFVSPLTNTPMRWRQMQKLAPDISIHPLPVMLPVFNSWSRDAQDRARQLTSDELGVSCDRVKLIEFQTPSIVDADLVRMLQAWEPQRIKLRERQLLPPAD